MGRVAVASVTAALPGCLPLPPSPLLDSCGQASTPETAGKGREGGRAPNRSEELGDLVSSGSSLSLVLLSGCLKNQFCACFLFFLYFNEQPLWRGAKNYGMSGLGGTFLAKFGVIIPLKRDL